MRREKILNELYELKDEKYREFNIKLIPNIREDKIIGVRIPMIRKFAKTLLKEKVDIADLLTTKDQLFYEEKLLLGYMIGYKKQDFESWKNLAEAFVPLIDNWSVCDGACSTMKIANTYQEETWEFIQKYLDDTREYYIRFGVVMVMTYYLNDQYIKEALEKLTKVKTDDYYAMMAVAWAVSVAFVKYPDLTFEIIKSNQLDVVTHNKAIQKIRESYRVSKEIKDELLKYKRRD